MSDQLKREEEAAVVQRLEAERSARRRRADLNGRWDFKRGVGAFRAGDERLCVLSAASELIGRFSSEVHSQPVLER